MHRHCKIAGILTFSQLEVIKALQELSARRDPKGYWAPRDLGGYRSSHHAHTLQRLQEMGYVEKTALESEGARPKFGYRITSLGAQLWDEFRELLTVPASHVMGGKSDKGRLLLGQRLLH
jgi:DNA-binding MarR family transcriptional regulator